MSADLHDTDRDFMVRCLVDGVASKSLQREAAHELERAWMAEARIARDLGDTQDALRMALDALKRMR